MTHLLNVVYLFCLSMFCRTPGFTRASNIVPTLTKVWDWAGIKLKTPGLAVRHATTFWLPPQGGAYSRSLTSKYSLSPPIHVGRGEADTNDSCITFIFKCIKQASVTQITCDNTTRTAPMCDCQPSVHGACSLSLIKRCPSHKSLVITQPGLLRCVTVSLVFMGHVLCL